MTIGYFWADTVGAIAHEAARVGAPLLGVAAPSIVAYLVYRHVWRQQRFLQERRRPCLSAGDLKGRLEARVPRSEGRHRGLRGDTEGIRGPGGAPVEDEVAEGSHVPAILQTGGRVP